MKKVLVCLLIGLAMLTTSCKKNEENSNQNDSKSETPIAVYDNKTGIMTYSFDVDMLNIKINEQFTTRTEQPSDRYIVESTKLVNKNNDIYTVLEVVYIDTEEGTSTTTWLTDNFIKYEIQGDKTYYYINDDVKSNNYSFCYNVGRDVYIADVVNGFSSSRKWDGLSKLPARWFVQCTGHNCNASTCQPEEFEGYYGCTPCSVVDKDHWCEQTTTSGEGLGSIIGGILSGIRNIVK